MVPTLINHDQLLRLYDEELRRKAPFFDAQVRLERDSQVVRLVGPTADAGNNCVLYSELDSHSAPTVVAREIRYFQTLGHSFEWKHHEHDQPPELAQLLLASGFTAGEKEEILAAELSTLHLSAAPPPGYIVRQLAADESLASLLRVQKSVWPELSHDWLFDSLLRERQAHPESISFYLVFHGEEPVSGGWMRLHGRFASMFGGSTLAAHRGRGLYRAVLAERLYAAAQHGAAFALVDAGPMSRPILKNLGFQTLTGTTPYVYSCEPPASS